MRTHIGFSANNLEEAITKLAQVGFIFEGKGQICLSVEGYDNSPVAFLGNGLVKEAAVVEKAEEIKEEVAEVAAKEEVAAPKKEKATKAKKEEVVEEKTEEIPSEEEVKAAAQACSKKHGIEVLKKILNDFGYKSIKEIAEDKRAAFIAELKA